MTVRSSDAVTIVDCHSAAQLRIESRIATMIVTHLNTAPDAVYPLRDALPKVWHRDGHTLLVDLNLDLEILVVEFDPW